MAVGVDPVSYTHLDVYKRQLGAQPAPIGVVPPDPCGPCGSSGGRRPGSFPHLRASPLEIRSAGRRSHSCTRFLQRAPLREIRSLLGWYGRATWRAGGNGSGHGALVLRRQGPEVAHNKEAHGNGKYLHRYFKEPGIYHSLRTVSTSSELFTMALLPFVPASGLTPAVPNYRSGTIRRSRSPSLRSVLQEEELLGHPLGEKMRTNLFLLVTLAVCWGALSHQAFPQTDVYKRQVNGRCFRTRIKMGRR